MRSMKLDVPTAPGEKRYNAGLASVWHTGRVVRVGAGWAAACLAQTKKAVIEGHFEIDFLPEVSMLWDHVASSRPTRTRRSRITRCSVLLFWLCLAVSGNMQP